MPSSVLALLAFAPILLAAILLIGLRWPAKHANAVSLCHDCDNCIVFLGDEL